jgi:hypothetical protein
VSRERCPAALLHNMSCRPSTETRAYIKATRSPVVRFELALLGVDLAGQARRGEVPAELLAAAEELWAGVPFTGAALVFAWAADIAQPPEGFRRPAIRLATDPCTALNVLGRARGALLLPRWPLAAEPEYLLRSLASDDPRLVALAERTGWEER